MNPETTDRKTENTAALQFKIIGRSPNNLPNNNSDENFQYLHTAAYTNTNANALDGTSYVRQLLFDNPVMYDAYFKRVISGKQTINKSHYKNIFYWTATGLTQNSIYIYSKNFMNTSDVCTAGELFYILFSLEIA